MMENLNPKPYTLNPLKIIFVTCALNVGGAEKFLYDLLKHIDKEKFAPQLATVIGGGTLEPEFRALGIPVHIYGRRRLRYLGGIVQFCQLYFLFRREKPRVVHTQLFAADVWGRLAAWLARVPIIITTEQNINRDESCLRHFLKRLTYRLADKTVAISSAVKKYVVQEYGVAKEKVEVIPNDVDVVNLKSQTRLPDGQVSNLKSEISERHAKKIILTVGRLVEQKGHKYLLEAFAKLSHPEEYELWIAGDGVLREKLENQAKDLGVESRVKFLGERDDVPNLLVQADAFVFPSLWEGLGIAALEAAIAKTPIVASATDGIMDILQNNETGYLVEPADSEELAWAIEKIFRNPAKAEQMAEKAAQWVEKNFDVKVVVRRYEEVYLHSCHSWAKGHS